MVNVTQLGYLGIGIRDVEAWEQFATHILGLQHNGRDDDGSLFLKMDEYHHRFALHPNGNDDVQYVGWGARVVDDSTWQVQQHTRGSIWGHRPMAAQPAQQPVATRA